jgi:hypothetical protein
LVGGLHAFSGFVDGVAAFKDWAYSANDWDQSYKFFYHGNLFKKP